MAGEQFPWDTTRDLFALKLTWRPAANNSLSASVFGDPTEIGRLPLLAFRPAHRLPPDQLTGGTDGVINYDGVFGQNVVLSARVASHHQKLEVQGPGRGFTGFADFTDPFGNGIVPYGWEGVVSGWGSYSEEDYGRQQYNADASWFVGNLAGNHELKIGPSTRTCRWSASSRDPARWARMSAASSATPMRVTAERTTSTSTISASYGTGQSRPPASHA